MWEYNYTPYDDELYHYGVPGMKWGHRRAMRYEARTARKLGRAGKLQGRSDYYRDKGASIYKKHDSGARVLEKQANTYDKQGKAIRASLARKAASTLRARGSNIQAENDRTANSLAKRANKRLEKANAYAAKKKVSTDKAKTNKILAEAKAKSYAKEQKAEREQREFLIQQRLGNTGYSAYNRLRGRG